MFLVHIVPISSHHFTFLLEIMSFRNSVYFLYKMSFTKYLPPTHPEHLSGYCSLFPLHLIQVMSVIFVINIFIFIYIYIFLQGKILSLHNNNLHCCFSSNCSWEVASAQNKDVCFGVALCLLTPSRGAGLKNLGCSFPIIFISTNWLCFLPCFLGQQREVNTFLPPSLPPHPYIISVIPLLFHFLRVSFVSSSKWFQ